MTDLQRIVNDQRAFFGSGATLPFVFRKNALMRLASGIRRMEGDILSALRADLGKSETEAYMSEVGLTLSEISYVLGRLGKWMRPERLHTPMANFPARSEVVCEPYGVSLVISPWNYPFLLALSPLVGALAAGNCCVVKPSELSQATSEAIARLVADVFPQNYVAVVNGGAEECQALLDERFDYILYTGGTAVGRIVMEKAARHLTPVTLELGGKSPVVVTRDADLRVAARRIMFGKLLNLGQTCVAPDYVLCEREAHDGLVRLLREEAVSMYGPAPLENPGYGKIINRRHFDRIRRLIDPSKVVWGGEAQEDSLRIAPTIMDGVSSGDAVMQEEIFGPVLPVIAVGSPDEAFNFIRERPHPLALYLFTRSKATERKFIGGLQFGGGCVNDTISHLVAHNLPFGGIGDSGMGSYHGRDSFLAFSHRKAVVRRGNWPDCRIRYQPYGSFKSKVFRWLMR